jgi:hypothetical protein
MTEPVITITGSGNTAEVVNVTSPSASSGITLERIELTLSDISAKQVELSEIPKDPGSVVVFPQGGIPQFAGIDFVVTNNILSWNKLGLDGFLESGEFIVVQY